MNVKYKLLKADHDITSKLVSSNFRAFLRILCVCCPRQIRHRYQPAFRSKPSQVSIRKQCL